MDTKPIGAVQQSPATKPFGERVTDMLERGAPPDWLMRRYHMTREEFKDLTGEEVAPDLGANSTTGY